MATPDSPPYPPNSSVALQRICNDISANQFYFVRHTLPGDRSKTWLDVLIEQLEAPLGPAVTLATLIVTNRELQKQVVTNQLVDKCVAMSSHALAIPYTPPAPLTHLAGSSA